LRRTAGVERIRMSTMAETRSLEPGTQTARPLSPHLQIYRPLITMVMSIVHRITGGALYFGTVLLAWWFNSAQGPSGYGKFEAFAGSWIGRLILFGYTWALIHHMLGGVRHLIWDSGRGFGPNEREWLAAANLIGSIAITVILWIVGLLAVGGPQ
jgi:succinate dehydrogenase / fumarate reductase, cytochrome b subunit